jgi:hypothetical protein
MRIETVVNMHRARGACAYVCARVCACVCVLG